jgi:cell division inhibitor SulA
MYTTINMPACFNTRTMDIVRKLNISESYTPSSESYSNYMPASAKHSPVYLAPTLRGLSMQSFFLCVIAPQFSQAPFLYFTATEVYRKGKIKSSTFFY